MSDSATPLAIYSLWNSPGQNTGVGSFSLFQGIFPTQGSNPGLLHCRCVLYQLSHKGRPRILEWVAYSFSSGSTRPRNRTWVSCIAGGFFTNWAIRELFIYFLKFLFIFNWRIIALQYCVCFYHISTWMAIDINMAIDICMSCPISHLPLVTFWGLAPRFSFIQKQNVCCPRGAPT